MLLLRRNHVSASGIAPFYSPRWLHITYLVLVVAAIGMTILELARLIAESLGVALLPLNTVTLILVFAVLVRERKGRTRGVTSVSTDYVHVHLRLTVYTRLWPYTGCFWPSSRQSNLSGCISSSSWILQPPKLRSIQVQISFSITWCWCVTQFSATRMTLLMIIREGWSLYRILRCRMLYSRPISYWPQATAS